MSSTLSQMQARIADDINRSDLNTQILVAINRAVEYYAKNNRFWFNETTGTFNTIASQFAYTSSNGIPTDIMELDLVKIAITSTNNIILEPRTYKYLQFINIGNTTGAPFDYSYYKQSFYIYPIPNAVYTITVSYAKSYAALAAASDTNDFLTYAEDLIESRASWWIYKRILKNYEAANDSKQEESDSLLALMSETERMDSSGRVRPSTF